MLFAARSARRNFVFCLLIAALVGALGSTVVAAIPPVYEATVKIFVQEGGAVTSALASGRDRFRPVEGGRGLEEFIFARANLLSIAREAKLVETWPNTRTLPMYLKDRAVTGLLGPTSRKDMERGFVEMLTTSITAAQEGDSVRVHAQWREKQNAYEIARLVQRNFLAAREEHDLGPIQRAISFLETQLQQADEAIEGAVVRVQTAQSQSGRPPSSTTTTTTSARPAKSSASDTSLQELATMSRQLAEARREQRVLVEPWRRKLAELKAQELDLKVQYSANHPLVLQLQARIAAATEVPEELAALRKKEAELLATLSRHGGGTRVPGESAAERAAAAATDDPALEVPKTRLFNALRKSDEIASRLDDARIELATAEADFKHRYVVVEEPEVPTKPLKAKKPLLFVVVFFASLLLGVVAGALRELLRGRLDEAWQVRSLGIPLLAEVEIKKLPPNRG